MLVCREGFECFKLKAYSPSKNWLSLISSSSSSLPGAPTCPRGKGQVRSLFTPITLSTINRSVISTTAAKLEDGAQHKNLRVFSVSTGEQLASFTQKSQDGWNLQYTISESHAIRLVGQDIHVFRPSEWSKGIVDKLKIEGATSISLSPGLSPSVAVFIAEKNASFR